MSPLERRYVEDGFGIAAMQVVIAWDGEAGDRSAYETHRITPFAPEAVVVSFIKQVSGMNDESGIGSSSIRCPDCARPH